MTGKGFDLQVEMEKRGWGIEEVGSRLGVEPRTVWRWVDSAKSLSLTGTPGRDMIYDIADLFGTSPYKAGEYWGVWINTLVLHPAVPPKPCGRCQYQEVCGRIRSLALPAPCEGVGMVEVDGIVARGLGPHFFSRYKVRYYNGKVRRV
jgi:hypothetical protein